MTTRRRIDLGLCALVLVVTWLSSFGPGAYRMSIAASVAVSLPMLAVAWTATRRPEIALAIAVATTAVLPLIDATFEAIVPLIIVVGFQVALRGRLHPAVLAGIVIVTLTYHDLWVRIALDRALVEPSSLHPLLFTALAVGLGRQGRRIADQHDELIRLHEVDRSRIVSEERRRIARDVHDVAAHHLSALIVRNQLARRQNTADALSNAAEFTAMTASEALDSLRQVVRVLDVERRGPLSPAPSLSELGAIVDRMRNAGLDVHADVQLNRTLPCEIEIAGTRIVQEAFANILRHRGPGHAWLLVCDRGSQLDVVIEDDGGIGSSAGARSGGSAGGAGLIGMHERAESCGGTLAVGPSERGGWRVSAVLPVTDLAIRP